MKFIRIFLLVLIIIGIGLLLTQKIWVPKLVDKIISDTNEYFPVCNVNNSYKKQTAPCNCPPGYDYKLTAILDDGSNRYGCITDYAMRQKEIVKTTYSLVAPNGGEKIKAGSIYEIRWDPNLFGNIDTVNINLNDDSIKCGTGKKLMIGCWSSFVIINTKNTGSYMWDTSKKLFGDAGPDTVQIYPKSSYRISIYANLIQLKSQNTFSIIP